MIDPSERPFGLPIDHLGVAVHDLDAAVAPWALLGLPPVEDEEVPEQGVRVRLLRAGDAWIELLAPTRDDAPVGRFLAKRGEGLHHVALRVDDVEVELARLVGAGARAIDARPRRGRAGSRVAFLHPGWAHGVLIELVQPAAPR